MPVVAFVGGPGKTTAAWLLRGVLEEAGALVALADSSEYALHADRLDAGGGLWEPAEPDPTANRECSAAFHLAPYKGKYPDPEPAPDGVRLARVLAGAADRGASAAVVGLGGGALAAGAGGALSPDVLVFVGSPVEPVAGLRLPPDAPECRAVVAAFAALVDPDRQRAVVNLDDPLAREVIEAAAGVPILTYAAYNRSADMLLVKGGLSLVYTGLVVRTPITVPNPDSGKLVRMEMSVETPLIGKGNHYNVLAAATAALAVGDAAGDGGPGEESARAGRPPAGFGAIDLKTIVNGIEATEVVPGRCERLDEAQKFAVFVDAAPNAAALGMLLDGLREAGAKRVITVLSADGGSPAAGRAFLGETAHYKSDIVVVANGNPRGEAPDAIAGDVCAGFPARLLARNARTAYPPGFLQDPGRVPSTVLEFLWSACWQEQRYVCEDRWMAVRWAIGTASPEDAVVIAGKGAQDYAEWLAPDGAPVRGWFDDRVEARAALAKAHHLWVVTDLDRKELPWVEWDEREARI